MMRIELGKLGRIKLYQKFVLLFVITFLAYGLTLGMYIWQDDNAIMFKLQHMAEGAGNLGEGIFDRNTPYRGVLVPLVPLYAIFGLEPIGYFAVGIIVYFLAAVAVYYLAKELKDNEDFAYGASLIFAAGFIGGETLWRIYNSIHTILNIIFICISLIFYSQAVKQGSLIKYLISLFFFWVAMETGYVRAHGIVFLILGLEFIIFLKKIKSIFRVLPFIALYYYYYLRSNVDSGPVHAFFNKIFTEGRLEILLAPFLTLKNIIIPDTFPVPDWLFLGLLFLLLVWKRSRLLWFSVVIMMQSYLIPFIHNQGQVFASLHRYLTLSLVGLAIFYSELFSNFFKQKKLFFAAVLLVVFSHLYLIDKEQLRIVRHIGIPTRNFYKQLTEQLREVPKGSAIYFDVAADAESQNQFYNFFGVGSMPETTAIAIYYKIDRYDLTLPATFNELLSQLKNNQTSKDKIFTFYFDASSGLLNTTHLTRDRLFNRKDDIEIKSLEAIDLYYSSPALLSFTADTKVGEIKFDPQKADNDFENYLAYLLSRNDFYSQVSATASSQWKYQEIENAVDNNPETSWMAHRGNWHYNRIEDLILDLKSEKNIGAVRIKFRSKGKAAINYVYQCSLDESSWTDVKDIYRNITRDSEDVVDKLPDPTCRYLKLTIKKTLNDDEPQISEIEVVNPAFSDLDYAKAGEIAENPFIFVATEQDKQELEKYLNVSGIKARVCKDTDKRVNPDPILDCQEIKLKLNEKSEYSIIIPPEGTILQSLKINVTPLVKVDISNPVIRFLTFDELLERGYIFDYSQN